MNVPESSELNTEIIDIKNISISDNPINSKIDQSYGNFKNDLNFINAKIDESHMPTKLYGKQWMIKKTIGEGTNFKTYLAMNRSGEMFAIRRNRKQDRSTKVYEEDEEVQKEIANFMKLELELDMEMMKLIGVHPNITALIGFRQVGLCWEQFMEYVDGGNLFDYINRNYIKQNQLLEVERAYSFFIDLLNAVEHIHSLKIAHMDIKLENCLITRNGIVKLTDFDEARYFVPNLKIPYPIYFTESYAAPETFTKRYRPNCADIWACGIFLYFLLQQHFPWKIAKRRKDATYRKWSTMHDKSVLSLFPQYCECISDLLMKILNVEVEERATLEEIRKHKWLENQAKCCG
ncbi:Serine/threonine-protein kinase [Dirofilaria immitis]